MRACSMANHRPERSPLGVAQVPFTAAGTGTLERNSSKHAAAVPPVALRVPAKKVAALVALPVAAFYLALAGRGIPTERAFITVAVMLGAVLLDRQAITLRSVAIAALIVLALRPESLMNPGFQMSFAAVVALVYAFGLLPGRVGPRPLWARIAIPVLALAFSSLIAGSATAPYAAAHFNRRRRPRATRTPSSRP